MKRIDLRSDTVTTPTPEMRRAMYEAEVGDDDYGEDPTVNRLQEEAAAMFGKEAALFVTSGTQGNQVAVLTHTRRGEEVICEADSHVFYYEAGGVAALAGCQPRTIPGVRGAMDPEAVRAAIRPKDHHQPRTALVCLENTHNRAGGCILPQENVEAVAAVAHAAGIPVHLDGARIFNAAVATGRSVAELTAPVDSLTFCLSKGLAAPAGSVLLGTREFIEEARVHRKRLGGGLRQAGILAAAGLVGLHSMVERLAEDHENARTLAQGLNEIDGLEVHMETVQTNMVMCDLLDPRWDAASFVAALREAGVLVIDMSPRRVRFVTHKDVSAADIQEALARIARIVKASPGGSW